MTEIDGRNDFWAPRTAAEVEEQAENIAGAVDELTKHLDEADLQLALAERVAYELVGLHAAEYVEGTRGDDIRHHLADAARALRAATAIHWQARHVTLSESAASQVDRAARLDVLSSLKGLFLLDDYRAEWSVANLIQLIDNNIHDLENWDDR
jgi:hypothetical protein